MGSFGTQGSGSGNFNAPDSLSFNTSGIAYVDDTGNSRISVWTAIDQITNTSTLDNTDQTSGISVGQSSSTLP